MKQINIFIEMITCVVVLTVKVILDLREGINFYKFPSEGYLKQQWLIKIKLRNI